MIFSEFYLQKCGGGFKKNCGLYGLYFNRSEGFTNGV